MSIKVAVLSPVAWRTPPKHYGPWEQVASNICEGLVSRGMDVTLFATGDSLTSGKLQYTCERGYEEDKETDAKVAECMHISYLMEQAGSFQIIHNHFDFLPLTYTRLIDTPVVTTIHGFSSQKIIPVYRRYNDINYYVSISNSDRSPLLNYTATVYNGLNPSDFTFREKQGDYLLFFGRIHHDKGTREAIEIAKKAGMKLIISGIVQDEAYFNSQVKPFIDDEQIVFMGSAGPEKRDSLLGGAYALLHPVNFEEPFGLSVAESMLCGTPVIAFNRGSMPELVKHNETGFLVSDIEEAVEALNNVRFIKRGCCREWAMANFSVERMVDDYINVYKKVLT